MVYTFDAIVVETVDVGVLVPLFVLETMTRLVEEDVVDCRHIVDNTDSRAVFL